MKRANTWEVIIGDTESQFSLIAAADGAQVQFAKELGYALQIIDGNDYLQRCSTESLRNAFLNVAGMGLTLNPAMKLAYLVPRDGRACLDISYIGLLHVATESGSIMAAKAEVVRENDYFEYHNGLRAPTHQFNPFTPDDERGKIVGVYCLTLLANGATLVESMNLEMLDKIKKASKGSHKAGSPWNEWYEEMCKKAVIKRAYKSWPARPRMSKIVDFLNEQEGNAVDITPPTAALPPPDSAAQALLAELEAGILQGGTGWYHPRFKQLDAAQRALLGLQGHHRLWEMALRVDDENGAGA